MPTEEIFTSPNAAATSGTFRCTFPLSFRGRLIEGLRGEFAGGRLVRLDADSRRRSRLRRRLPRHRQGRGAGSARSRSSTRRSRIGQTRAGRTTTRCSTRTPQRTSRSAAASAAPAPSRRRAASTARRRAPRRDDRQPEARGDRHRPAQQADPAHPRRPLADLNSERVLRTRSLGGGTPQPGERGLPAAPC